MPTKTPQNKPTAVKRKTQPALRSVTQPPPKASHSALTEEQIAARAYEIWQRRGCPLGQDGQCDWYAARAELEQEQVRL
jgi:Protein of unknown function (DUF2934)